MAEMADPSSAMASFEAALRSGEIRTHRGQLDPNLQVYFDQVTGRPRWVWARLDRGTVRAFANAGTVGEVAGLPCFQFGWAVPVAFRGQGLATGVVRAAVAEMRHGFGRNGLSAFHVEAVVQADNLASRRVAEKALGVEGTAMVDMPSGEPAVRYLATVSTGSA